MMVEKCMQIVIQSLEERSRFLMSRRLSPKAFLNLFPSVAFEFLNVVMLKLMLKKKKG